MYYSIHNLHHFIIEIKKARNDCNIKFPFNNRRLDIKEGNAIIKSLLIEKFIPKN